MGRYLDLMGTMFLYSVASTAICSFFVLTYRFLCSGIHYRRVHPEDGIIAFLLIAVSSLRYGVGSDFFRYVANAQTYFSWYSDLHRLLNWNTIQAFGGQIGYPLLCVISGYISNNEYAILWVTSALMYIPLVHYCRKYTNNSFIAFAVYLYFGFWGMSLNVLKQAISMIFFIYAYEKLEEDKYFSCGIYLVLTFLFHASSIIPIVGLFVTKMIRPTKKAFWIAIILGVIFRMSYSLIARILNSVGLLNRYASYFGGEKSLHTDRTFIWMGALIETLIVALIVYYAIEQIDQIKSQRKDANHMISMLIFGLPFSIVGISGNLWLSNRLAKYFFVLILPLSTILLGKKKEDVIGTRRVGTYFLDGRTRALLWGGLIIWHMMYSVLMLDNSEFIISTYLFH